MHDTRLEDSLRRALHEEADALPFTITVDDLNVRLAQRPRPVSRLGILSAAAAVVIVVGVGAFLANQGPGSTVGHSPQPSATPSPALGTFEDMLEFAGPGGIEVLRGESLNVTPGDDDLVTTDIGQLATAGVYGILHDCTGPGPFGVAWRDPDTREVLTSFEVPSCEGDIEHFSSPEQPAGTLLTVSAPRETSWRVLAYEPQATLPDLDINAAGWNLMDSFDVGSDHKEPLTGSIGNQIRMPVGTLLQGPIVQVAAVCLGEGRLEFWLSPEGSSDLEVGSEIECNGRPDFTEMTPATEVPYQLSISVDGRAAWRLVAGVPSEALVSQGPLGEFAEVDNTTILDELSGGSEASAQLDLPVPAGTDNILTLVMCTGGGELRLADGTSTHVKQCDGPNTSTLFSSVPPASELIHFTVDTTNTSWKIRFLAQDLESNPDLKFIPPAATLIGPAADSRSVVACGLSFQLADGSTASDSCAAAYPVVPADRALHVAAGSELTFEIGDGWQITGLTGTFASSDELIAADGFGVTFNSLVDLDGGSASVTFAAPGPGDWMVLLRTGGALDGDTYSVPYMFRVIVEP